MLFGPGGTPTGVVFNGIAVFDFNSITVGSGQTFVGTGQVVEGALPLALLSRGDITINGTIDVSAPGGSPGGPGGFDGGRSAPGAGGFGPGGGGAGGFIFTDFPQPPYGPPTINYSLFGGGGGGGFGGSGYAGMPVSVPGAALPADPAGVPTRTSLASSKAAAAAASVSTHLVAAAAGRSSSVLSATSRSRAQSWPTVVGASWLRLRSGGGGGAGGGILLHGEGVTLSGLLSAVGGNGGPGGEDGRGFPFHVAVWGAGGNGGGGQVVIDPEQAALRTREARSRR